MNPLMYRIAPILAFMSLASVACLPRAESGEGKQTTRLPENSRKLKVLVLEGTPHNRGLVHGRAMKDQIHEVVRLWKAILSHAFKMDADVLEEIRGLAEGAGTDFNTMFVLQLPDECFVHGDAITGNRCSSLGFSKS